MTVVCNARLDHNYCSVVEEMIKTNFEERISKLKNLLNIWEQRNLTIKGKITTLKAKAPPLITYVSTFISVPKHIINSIDKILYDFIWKNKHHVKKTTLIGSPSHGGLKMPHTELVIKSNKLKLLKRIIDRPTNCNTAAAFILKIENMENFLRDENSVRFLHSLPKFYEQLLDMWYSIHNTEPTTINEILQEHIWYFARILIRDKPVFNKVWFQVGIECIQDLCEGNSLMTKDMLSQKYQISCDFLFYNGLKAALPITWLEKSMLQTMYIK